MPKHTPGPWSCWSTSNHAHDYRLFKPNGDNLPYAAPGNDHSEAFKPEHVEMAIRTYDTWHAAEKGPRT